MNLLTGINAYELVAQTEKEAGGQPESISLHVRFDRDNVLNWIKEARPEYYEVLKEHTVEVKNKL